MNPTCFMVFVLLVTAPALAAAETMNFESATTILGESCGKDIDANCRGVNLDVGRLKECLVRNQDVVSPKCQADYPRVFAAIAQRISSRAAVYKLCDHEAVKLCGATPNMASRVLPCLLTQTKGMSFKCNQAISAAGYR